MTFGQSTKAHTVNIATGATENAATKTINIGTGGVSGSITYVNIGSDHQGMTTINNDLTIKGNFIVDGTTTTINSSTLSVDDKNIELGSAATIAGVSGTSTVGSSSFTIPTGVVGLIPGMAVTVTAGTLTLTGGRILSIDTETTITLTANFGGTGTAATVTFGGPSDYTADGGGITLKGDNNKTIL
jgi:hypothetical protein